MRGVHMLDTGPVRRISLLRAEVCRRHPGAVAGWVSWFRPSGRLLRAGAAPARAGSPGQPAGRDLLDRTSRDVWLLLLVGPAISFSLDDAAAAYGSSPCSSPCSSPPAASPRCTLALPDPPLGGRPADGLHPAGSLTQERRIAPLSRVQPRLQRGPLEQLFRLDRNVTSHQHVRRRTAPRGRAPTTPRAQRLVHG